MHRKTIAALSIILAAGMAMAPAASVSAAQATQTTITQASEITGLPISSSIASQRPVAIMIDNDTRALPHYGLAGAYDYYENGKISQDGEDKQTVSFSNVILQDVSFTQYDKNGYLIYNVIGTGIGYYCTGGKMIPITWQKTSETGVTKYYDATGAEITLNAGKTYIGICPSDDWASVTVG